ncbi:uncharacterized protein LOC141932311 [Strix aluco]|uniref:uncharacterized protein LOC141932311 n=1 Tax=Strix aluco TaxID=111821 RepID=UPI003DA26AA5
MGASLFCLFTDVAGGDHYPVSQLGSRGDAQGDGTGPQRAKYISQTGKPSQWTSEVMQRILKELDRTTRAHAVPEANGHPTARPDLVSGPGGDRTDVAGGDHYPVSQLGSRGDAQGDGTGPQRAKYISQTGKPSQWTSEVMQRILKELDRTTRAHAVPEANGHPTARPDLVSGPGGDRTDVAGGDHYPVSQLGSRGDAQGDGTGPQRAKYISQTGKPSQWTSEVMQRILKELDRTTRAHAVPEANGHPTARPDLVSGPGGDRTDVAGGDHYPVSQLGSRGDAQGDGTDVGTGKAFPAPHPDPALALPWRRRGPQRAKYNSETGKPSQWASEVVQRILKELHRTTRAHAVSEAKGHPTARPDLVSGPGGDRTDVAGGDHYPVSQLGSRGDAQGDGTGPQRAKYNSETGKPSQWASEVVQRILKELHRTTRAHGMNGEPVEKEAFREGGSQAAPASDERTGAMQSTGVAGTDGKSRPNATDHKNPWTHIIKDTLRGVGLILASVISFCVVHVCMKLKRCLTKTSGSQPPAPSLPPEQPDCPLEQLYHGANPFRIFSTYLCCLPSSHQVCDRKRHFHIYWPNISNSLPQGSNCLCWLLSSPRNRGIHYNV